jgi:hypothetical protein
VLHHLKFKTMFYSTKMYKEIMADFVREERMKDKKLRDI